MRLIDTARQPTTSLGTAADAAAAQDGVDREHPDVAAGKQFGEMVTGRTVAGIAEAGGDHRASRHEEVEVGGGETVGLGGDAA